MIRLTFRNLGEGGGGRVRAIEEIEREPESELFSEIDPGALVADVAPVRGIQILSGSDRLSGE
jgi:hypothetical protein